MKRPNFSPWIVASAVSALTGFGCASESHAEPSTAALQQIGAAGSGSAVDRDRDVDEGVDEANDRDDDSDEASDGQPGSRDDFDLAYAELPAAVQATVDAELGAGTVTGIDRDQKQSGLVFEVEYTRDGVAYEVDVAEDGALLRSKRD